MNRLELIIVHDYTIPRFYVYLLSRPNGDPFYIGKGKDDRIVEHEREARRGCDCRKCRVIRKIWQSGDQVQRSILFETDDESQALACEKEMIALYGRAALVNHTDGGEGSPNLSEEARAKISAYAKTRTYSEETRAKISAYHKGRKQPPEVVAKRVASQRGQKRSPEIRAKMSQVQKARVLSDEARARINAAVRARVFSEEALEKIRAARKRQVLTEETRAKISAAGKRRAPASPESRARMSAARAAYWAKKRAEKNDQET